MKSGEIASACEEIEMLLQISHHKIETAPHYNSTPRPVEQPARRSYINRKGSLSHQQNPATVPHSPVNDMKHLFSGSIMQRESICVPTPAISSCVITEINQLCWCIYVCVSKQGQILHYNYLACSHVYLLFFSYIIRVPQWGWLEITNLRSSDDAQNLSHTHKGGDYSSLSCILSGFCNYLYFKDPQL